MMYCILKVLIMGLKIHYIALNNLLSKTSLSTIALLHRRISDNVKAAMDALIYWELSLYILTFSPLKIYRIKHPVNL